MIGRAHNLQESARTVYHIQAALIRSTYSALGHLKASVSAALR